MGKKSKNESRNSDITAESNASLPKIKRKEFEEELAKLQVELTRLQAWAVAEGGLERDNIAATSIEELAGIAAPPLAVIINGGCRTAYGVPMREGDTIRSTLSLASYAVKQGKGGPLLITETDEVWTNQSGEMVREARLTVVRY